MKTPSHLPVRGLHFAAPLKNKLDALVGFIRGPLVAESVNLLVIEFGYHFAFKSHPEIACPDALGYKEMREVSKACREAGIRLIPQMACFGHQGIHDDPGGLLKAYPEFIETPHLKGNEKDFYCHSWCSLHPELHDVVFALIDELCDACETDAFHAGMDEVFFIADDKCPRCAGKNPADIFADEVTRIHDHVSERGLEMWMWGDRFLESKRWETGKWSGSENDTWPALEKVSKQIVICDWHYTWIPKTTRYFVESGFRTVMSPWNIATVALGQLETMLNIAGDPDPETAARSLGVLATSWCGFDSFADAYAGRPVLVDRAASAANAFKVLFSAFRGERDYRGHIGAVVSSANV